MDIHQLRSWIFELYEPLEDERQYIVFDRARGNLLIDAPPFSERALRLIRGTGPASLLLITNGARGTDAARYRDALGVQIAAHADDASFVPGGADLVLTDADLIRPDARVIRVGAGPDGATVMLGRKAGGVLFCGDLDLASDAAGQLTAIQFSAVLSARRAPIWNAGRDTLQFLQRELPQPRKRFGILLQAPWDRAYKGRLEDQMKPNPLIVPAQETAAREAAMGPRTLVVADQVRARTEAAPRPVRGDGSAQPAPPAAATAAGGRGRPRSFAEDWNAAGTIAPPTTMADPPADLRPPTSPSRLVPLGDRFHRLDVAEVAGRPTIDVVFGGIDLSPDGAEVAFSWDQSGVYELYAAPIGEERIIQLTESGRRSVSPRWSPAGDAIAFLRDDGGSERFGIWIVDRDGAHERALAAAGASGYRDIAWSPDGRSILGAATVDGGRSLLQRIDVATGALTPLTDGAFADTRPRPSPDGSWILFESRRSGARSEPELFIMPATGGPAVRLETSGGPGTGSTSGHWSPDGRSIAFTSSARGRREVGVVDWDGVSASQPRYLTEDPFEEREPLWRPDGRGVIFLQDKDAARTVHRVFAVSHVATPVMDLPGMYGSPRVGPDSETVVAVFSSPRRSPEVWVREGDQLTSRALTRAIGAPDPSVLVEPSVVRYAGADGHPVMALLFVPHAEAVRGSGLAGAVMYLADGLVGEHHRAWDPLPQLLANRGLVVLAPQAGGAGQLADALLGVDWLAAEGIADATRVGIIGGDLALLALAAHPDRFIAGVSNAGIASPIVDAGNIRAALLVLQGANDPRVQRGEAARLAATLERTGVPYQYREYADEGRGFSKAENRIDASQRTVEWLAKHLTPMMDRYLGD